jgi:hypothetical protein
MKGGHHLATTDENTVLVRWREWPEEQPLLLSLVVRPFRVNPQAPPSRLRANVDVLSGNFASRSRSCLTQRIFGVFTAGFQGFR